jgi:hypothetical protein
VVGGVLIALGLPMAYTVAALMISAGIVAASRTGLFFELTMSLSLNALVGFLLALAGIAVTGSAARLRSGWAWLALAVIALPLIAFAWFLSYATLGGALGSPF